MASKRDSPVELVCRSTWGKRLVRCRLGRRDVLKAIRSAIAAAVVSAIVATTILAISGSGLSFWHRVKFEPLSSSYMFGIRVPPPADDREVGGDSIEKRELFRNAEVKESVLGSKNSGIPRPGLEIGP